VEGEDYVYGTGAKVRQLLEHLRDNCQFQLLGIVNSPGPSLIGDELQREVHSVGIRQPVVYVESPGFSNRWAEGYQRAMIEILKRIDYAIPSRKSQVESPRSDLNPPAKINLIGFMIGQHNWSDDLNEVLRMLELLGVSLNVNVGAGEKVENFHQIPSAAYNLVISEEYGSEIASYLEERFGISRLMTGILAPYGIDATEIWARAIAKELSLEISAFDREAEEVRRKCYSALSRIASVRGVPRGVRFAIFGDGYQVAPLSLFFYRYLGMYPAVIGLRECGRFNRSFLEEFIKREKFSEVRVLESPNQLQIAEALRCTQPEIVLGSNFEERIAAAELPDSAFIGTSFPVWNRFRLSDRPLVGLHGALVLVEEILNSLSRKIDLPE
jgi:nitrogenase molybdenum-iron protein alpha/beta subunit